MAQVVRYPYHGTLNGGTGRLHQQPGAISAIFGGLGHMGDVVGSGILKSPAPAPSLTVEQEQQRLQAIAALRAKQAQVDALTQPGGVVTGVLDALYGSQLPAPPLTAPGIAAINTWVQQVLVYVKQSRPPVRDSRYGGFGGFGTSMTMPGDAERRLIWHQQTLLKTYGVVLLKQAAADAGRPNWAESYVEGTYLLADAYIGLWHGIISIQRVNAARFPGQVTVNPNLQAPTRGSVRKLWEDSLRPRETAMLARAVPDSFRNTVRPATPLIVDESIVGRPTPDEQPDGAKAPEPGEVAPGTKRGGLFIALAAAAAAAFVALR